MGLVFSDNFRKKVKMCRRASRSLIRHWLRHWYLAGMNEAINECVDTIRVPKWWKDKNVLVQPLKNI